MINFIYRYGDLDVFCYGTEETGYKIGTNIGGNKVLKYFTYDFWQAMDYMTDLLLDLSKVEGINILDWETIS